MKRDALKLRTKLKLEATPFKCNSHQRNDKSYEKDNIRVSTLRKMG
jgi:hypothetical protein